MALLGPRVELETDISNKCLTVASAGVGLCVTTSGSGVNLGDSAGAVSLAANPSGLAFAGPLLHEVADIDETKFHRNYHKEQSLINEPCTIGRKGRWTTDKISGTPTRGDIAYLTTNGNFTPTMSATGGLVATPKAGNFRSAKDESGFAEIEFNLPLV